MAVLVYPLSRRLPAFAISYRAEAPGGAGQAACFENAGPMNSFCIACLKGKRLSRQAVSHKATVCVTRRMFADCVRPQPLHPPDSTDCLLQNLLRYIP